MFVTGLSDFSIGDLLLGGKLTLWPSHTNCNLHKLLILSGYLVHHPSYTQETKREFCIHSVNFLKLLFSLK